MFVLSILVKMRQLWYLNHSYLIVLIVLMSTVHISICLGVFM